MVQIRGALAELSPDIVSLFYTTDPFINDLPIIAFHGPSTSGNLTLNSSRVQIHVFGPAGFKSYQKLTISPSSPLYHVVSHLPRDQQGDEVARALAFGLLKYFQDLPQVVKTHLTFQSAQFQHKTTNPPVLFTESHAANLAAAMVQLDNTAEVIASLDNALQRQTLSSIDVDLVLPKGAINPLKDDDTLLQENDDDSFAVDTALQMYGEYAPLVKLFGDPCFLPTSKLRRAPSKASSLNRTKSFLKDQKLSLRREMGEFVDTEERYLIKLHVLVNQMATDFREKARQRSVVGGSPTEEDIRRLFPQSLDRILGINTSFLAAIQQVMDDTEEEAMQDLEADQADFRVSRHGQAARPRDPTGAVAFSKVLLEWFPRFSDCYQDYIRSSQEFPKLISSFLSQNSSFSKRVQQTGEQKLRSAIIEPVQRLPRYSLFIDNIVNYLPATHPALYSMLKARDIITTICALDPPDTDKSLLVTRLRNLVEMWPGTLFPKGRLISAVDVVELPPPYLDLSDIARRPKSMLLLFADTIVVLRKSCNTNFSARGLMMEVEKPSAEKMIASMTAGSVGQQQTYDLILSEYHHLNDIRFTEADNGRTIFMISSNCASDDEESNIEGNSPGIKAYLLQGAYDSKARKWAEDVCKARIEGRFSETERESEHWNLRSTTCDDGNLNLFTSVFEESVDDLIEGRKEPSPIRIVVDHHKGTKGAPVGHYGVEVVANVQSLYDPVSRYKLEVAGIHSTSQSELVTWDTFLPIFIQRVNSLLPAHLTAANPALSRVFIRFYSDVLRSIKFRPSRASDVDIVAKSPRPTSPVKLISNFLNGNGSLSHSTQRHTRMPVMTNIPAIQASTLTRTGSKQSELSVEHMKPNSRSGLGEEQLENNLVRLEQTFTAYMAALHSCKGDIVGKILRSRGTTPELSVNALYNTFIENPSDAKASTMVTFNVIFCAFEKFLMMAWKEQMGPVVTLQTMQSLQEKNAQLYPGDFADFIRTVFSDMAPQNKRAFISMIKLLADLLDGCGNDGDRGALTEAFAELLVTEGDDREFINLLDRLVEDADRLFDDYNTASSNGHNSPSYDPASLMLRAGKFPSKDGSLTSNSSLRKRFGFETLLRQNSGSKGEADSRPSMWRTLSKANKPELSANGASRGTISRSQSIDNGSSKSPIPRPVSHGRTPLLGAFDDRSSERPGSSYLNQVSNRLSTIQSSPPPELPMDESSKKHKRRSSLSDLMKAHTLGAPSPCATSILPPRMLPQPKPTTRYNTSPRTPSPTKQSIMDRTIKWNPESPDQKENLPLTVTLSPRNQSHARDVERSVLTQMDKKETIVVKDTSLYNTNAKSVVLAKVSTRKVSSSIPVPSPRNNPPKMRQSSITSPPPRPKSAYAHKTVHITTPRPNSSYGADPNTYPAGDAAQKTTTPKLRLQSTAKLRDRLAREKEAIVTAEQTLQHELGVLTNEVQLMADVLTPDAQLHIEALQASIRNVEAIYKPLLDKLTAAHTVTASTLESSLAVSEFKAKELDQLYKEASAENELMYERFNAELQRIIKSVRAKDNRGKDELITSVRDAKEEVNRVRKENGQLKREMASLKTILRATQLT